VQMIPSRTTHISGGIRNTVSRRSCISSLGESNDIRDDLTREKHNDKKHPFVAVYCHLVLAGQSDPVPLRALTEHLLSDRTAPGLQKEVPVIISSLLEELHKRNPPLPPSMHVLLQHDAPMSKSTTVCGHCFQ